MDCPVAPPRRACPQGRDRGRDPNRAAEDSDDPGRQREPGRIAIQYPGGLAARIRWTGSGKGEAMFALTEAGGTLTDHGSSSVPSPNGCAARRSASRDRWVPGRPASHR